MYTYYLKGLILDSQGELDQALINFFNAWEFSLSEKDCNEGSWGEELVERF